MNSIITTDKAKCRDCYRCVRVCPVKAIKISDGQACVDADRCIICGTCVRECPQKAKHVRSDLEKVYELLSSGGVTIASVAPSFPAAFPEFASGLLSAAIKKLGFGLVTETAVGAEIVARATANLTQDNNCTWVTSACPVVVNYIEFYHPELCKYITPIVSPMIAHAAYLKQKYGNDSKVVFIGPCSAKKGEAETVRNGLVDAVLTFDELRNAFIENGIDADALTPTAFDDVRPKDAQLFPLEGGLAKAASIASGLLRDDFVGISGADHIKDMVGHLSSGSSVKLFEALFCSGGCVSGACISQNSDVYARRHRVLKYHKDKQFEPRQELNFDEVNGLDFSRSIKCAAVIPKVFSEEQIRAVLAETGKYSPEDELNCGACGYSSCRENAIAVLSKMAERSMCLPWMRQLAERKADQIIDNSPNGIVMMDSNLNIVSFNPAFMEMFSCTDKLIGESIGALMDPEDFEKVAAEVNDRISGKIVEFPQYNLVASASIYRLEGENALIGIFANITKTKEDEDRIAKMRSGTIANAERVIEKQMRMAQEIAGILGETTSETRVLLRQLTDIAREAEERQEK